MSTMDFEAQVTDGDTLRNPKLFIYDGRSQWRCTICPLSRFQGLRKSLRHEDTINHVRRARDLDQSHQTQFSSDPLGAPGYALSPEAQEARLTSPVLPLAHTSGHEDIPATFDKIPPQGPHDDPQHDDEGGDLVLDLPFTVHGPALPDDSPFQLYDDYNGALATEKPDLLDKMVARMPLISNIFGEDEDGDDPDMFDTSELDAVSSTSSTDSEGDDGALLGMPKVEKATDTVLEHAPSDGVRPPDDEDWWPWRNKKDCLTDLLSAFPRAVFSEAELDVVRWYASELGLKKLPSIKAVKQRRAQIIALAGTEPRMLKGSLGHFYSVASLAKIIADEMSNPNVRPYLRFFPEDNNNGHSDAFHGERWRYEINANFSGPMVRTEDGNQDYFVDEPALAHLDDLGTAVPVWPTRWFIRDGKTYSMVHRLRVDDETRYIIDTEDCRELALDVFLLSYPKFLVLHATYGLPDPRNVYVFNATTKSLDSCADSIPNPWRTKAGGIRVMALPIWLYCDDTSGNVSKKWNKHNSFLFILAGLLQEHALRPYNIHFLSTSNLASPLEMLEAIAADIKQFQTNGLRVWDCLHQQYVLLIVWILAFLGDNPMQSELASHLGLGGKFFCRICKVRGKAKERDSGTAGEVERVCEFMQVGPLRTRDDTLKALKEQIDTMMMGAPSRIDALATKTGIKDKHLLPLFEELAATCAKVREHNKSLGRKDTNEGLLDALREIMGGRKMEDIINPIFRVTEINPHADTPVEILHVILLGIVKYFWRDAVARQNSITKKVLRTRLTSLAVTGLGIGDLQAATLVNYAGSLTGRDFRIIVQVAPAVLHGMIPEAAYEAWLALSRLAPLVFQPRIKDLDTYIIKLENAIDMFLGATALWTVQWFNKPKFHILLHLPKHVRRFAPAILTATEGFESYNLVIRLRSVHSNRHAPSKDIAGAMSFMHAARHLVSGGWVKDRTPGAESEPRMAGTSVRGLQKDAVFMKLMNMASEHDASAAERRRTKGTTWVSWSRTDTASVVSQRPSSLPDENTIVEVWPKVSLSNGDSAQKGAFVLWRNNLTEMCATMLGRITEILAYDSKPLQVLVQCWSIGQDIHPYRMPAISPLSSSAVISLKDVLCTIHAFHNCFRQRCEATKTRTIREEREITDKFELEFQHEKCPDDLILNLAQLRSAEITQTLRGLAEYPPCYSNRGDGEADERSSNLTRISSPMLQSLVTEAVQIHEAQKAMGPPKTTSTSRKRKATTSLARRTPSQPPSRHITPAPETTPSSLTPSTNLLQSPRLISRATYEVRPQNQYLARHAAPGTVPPPLQSPVQSANVGFTTASAGLNLHSQAPMYFAMPNLHRDQNDMSFYAPHTLAHTHAAPPSPIVAPRPVHPYPAPNLQNTWGPERAFTEGTVHVNRAVHEITANVPCRTPQAVNFSSAHGLSVPPTPVAPRVIHYPPTEYHVSTPFPLYTDTQTASQFQPPAINTNSTWFDPSELQPQLEGPMNDWYSNELFASMGNAYGNERYGHDAVYRRPSTGHGH